MQESTEPIAIQDEEQVRRATETEFITVKIHERFIAEPVRPALQRDPISTALVEKLTQIVPGDKKGRTYAKLIASRLVYKAANGNLKVASEIWNRAKEILHSLSLERPPKPNVTTLVDLKLLAYDELLLWHKLIFKAIPIPDGNQELRLAVEKQIEYIEAEMIEITQKNSIDRMERVRIQLWRCQDTGWNRH